MVPKKLYHISSQVPDEEKFLIPSKPRIRKNTQGKFVYASARPNYTYMFRQGPEGKSDNVINFYDFSIDDIDYVIVLTSNLDDLRKEKE
jgi:hypothetical protein